jgi:hypothetical protein
MITLSAETYLRCEQIRGYAANHAVQEAAGLVEHALSLPLPTERLGVAGYAMFAGPAMRSLGRPPQLGIPHRWWVVSAQRRELISDALTVAFPFANATLIGPVTVSSTDRAIASVHEDLKALAVLFGRAAPSFFAGEPGDAALRTDLHETLGAVAPPGVMPWYRVLAPGLFAWLGSAGVAR